MPDCNRGPSTGNFPPNRSLSVDVISDRAPESAASVQLGLSLNLPASSFSCLSGAMAALDSIYGLLCT